MFYSIIITIVGFILWLCFRNSSKSTGSQSTFTQSNVQETPTPQPRRYLKTRREEKDEYRQKAIEVYTKMGLADLLPRMIVEEGADGEFQIRWAGLNDEQEERILKATYENSHITELVDIREDSETPKVNVSVGHADIVNMHDNHLNGPVNMESNSAYIEHYHGKGSITVNEIKNVEHLHKSEQ